MESLSRRSVLIAGASALGVTALGAGGAIWRNDWVLAPTTPTPEFHGPSARLAEVVDAEPPDVCIVGSGPAGTALGLQLAQAGVRTLIVESGVNPGEIAKDVRYARLNTAEHSGDVPYALIPTRAMMPGGTSALWTGNTPRLLPIDFEPNAYTPDGCGWPVTYASMDGYYEQAETLLNVSGESNVRYMPPRSHALANERRGGNASVKALLKRADIHAFDTFRSRSSYGGPIRVARDLLPRFASLPSAIFLPGVTVRRFIGDSPEHIDSVLVNDMSGGKALIRARVFVLAAGGVESARRLLLSASEHFPQGLGNAHDHVGRTFGDHFIADYTGIIGTRTVRIQGNLPQTVRSFQFYETFKRRGLGSVSLTVSLRETPTPDRLELRITGDCEIAPEHSNRVTLSGSTVDLFGDAVAHLHFSQSERDRRTQAAMRALILDLYRQLHASNVEELSARWGHHHLGTVRMGNDARTSVVSSELQLHGVRNACVLTSGNFVTSGPANPTLLIVAFAQRLAAHLRARMSGGAYAKPARNVS